MAAQPEQDPIDSMLGSDWKVFTAKDIANGVFGVEDPVGGRRLGIPAGQMHFFTDGLPVGAANPDLTADRLFHSDASETDANEQGSITEVDIQAECFPKLAAIEAGKGVGLLFGVVEDEVAQIEGVASATWGPTTLDGLPSIVKAIAKGQEALDNAARRGMFPFKIIGVFKPGVAAYQIAKLFDEVPSLQFVMGGEFVMDGIGIDAFVDVLSLSSKGRLVHVDNVIAVDDTE